MKYLDDQLQLNTYLKYRLPKSIIWRLFLIFSGRTMTQAICRWPHIAEARDQSYVSSCGIFGERSMGQFSFRALGFPPMLHSHISFIYHVLCLILAFGSVLK